MKKHVGTVLVCVGCLLFLPSCYLTRAIRFGNFELKDLPRFLSDTLYKPNINFHFHEGQLPPRLTQLLDTNLHQSQTFSFLVIRNDSILYEKYFDGLTNTSLLPSFSVSKSFVATLLGIALKEGFIKNLHEPITNYLPELKKNDNRFEQITIQHVLDMRSGIQSSENYYNPTSDVLKLGFGNNLWQQIKKINIEKSPGNFDYKSVNTQLLAFIIQRATGKKFLDYFREKLWIPLQMENDATWNIDSKKRRDTRAFCCLNATTRDFAKLGKLYLQNGRYNEQQLLPEDWVKRSTDIDTMVLYEGYKNQWWSNEYSIKFRDSTAALNYIRTHPHCEPTIYVHRREENKEKGITADTLYYVTYLKEAYHAEGLLGQYIYVHPKKQLIIVRTGHYWQHPVHFSADHFIYEIAEKYF